MFNAAPDFAPTGPIAGGVGISEGIIETVGVFIERLWIIKVW